MEAETAQARQRPVGLVRAGVEAGAKRVRRALQLVVLGEAHGLHQRARRWYAANAVCLIAQRQE